MHTSDVLESLIDMLYDAALDAEKWPSFLAALAQTLEGTLPTLFIHNTRAHSGASAISVGYDAGIVRAYQDHFAERNIWLRSGAHLLTPGSVRSSHMMCSRKALLGSEWYADFCRPLDISQGIGATIHNDSVLTSNIAVFAGDGRAEYGRDDIALLDALMPHMQRAMRVHVHMAECDLRQREFADALEHMTAGVIMVTASAKVVFMNRAARSIVDRRDALLVDRTGLRALRSRETATLRALIGRAAQTTAQRGRHPGGEFRVARTNGRAALEIVVSPVSTGNTWFLGERAVAVVYVTDPGQLPKMPEAAMSRLYGLTQAEAKVAALIVGGNSGRQVADKLRLSYNTVKTHLKRIYAKTGTRGQGELIRLIVAGAWRVNCPTEVP